MSSDEQLIERYRQGDKSAFDEIYAKYKNAILSYAHSVYIIGADIEDVIQDGMIGLFKAVENYNGKSSFKNFAFTCIKTNIIKGVKKYISTKNLPLNSAVGIDECERELSREDYSDERIIFKEELEKILSGAKEKLSDFEQKVLNLFLQGYSYVEIAKILSKSPKSCDNAMQRIKKKLSGEEV